MKKIISLLTVLLLLSGCSNKEEKVITIGSKPHSEGYILAEMVTLLIEKESDITVKQTLGIGGGTSNLHPAMEKGEIDLYPEYTGTGWLFVLKNEPIANEEELFEKVKEEYLEKYNFYWFDPYGFNNTYGIAMKEEEASANNITKISELVPYSSNYIFGAEYDFFEREDGYEGFISAYNLSFKTFKDMDIGLKYSAIKEDQVQVIDVFTTDGLLQDSNLIVLEDDTKYFPSYYASTLVRQETLDLYPELIPILQKLEGIISEGEMIGMNFEVESKGREAKDVAKDFLILKGFYND